MLGERSINCLLYADDLVIFSKSAKNLQIILNKLESFCENADLRVNLDKTKIMIFNNCGKSLNNYLFRYGADELENVKSYKYLGLIMSPFGNFNLARQEWYRQTDRHVCLFGVLYNKNTSTLTK